MTTTQGEPGTIRFGDELDGARQAAALLEAGEVEEAAGRFADAEELASYGLDGGSADPLVRLRLLRLLGRCHARAGRRDAAKDVFERAIGLARGQLSPVEVAECVADLLTGELSFSPPPSDRLALAHEALLAAERPALRARLLALLAASVYETDLRRSRELSAQAVALVTAGTDEPTASLVHGVVAYGAAGSGQSAQVDALRLRRSRPAGRPAAGPLPLELGPALARGDHRAVDEALAGAAATTLDTTRDRGLVQAATLSRAVCEGDRTAVARIAPSLLAHPDDDVFVLGALLGLLWSLHTGEVAARRAAPAVSGRLSLGMARLHLNAAAAIDAAGTGAAVAGFDPSGLLAARSDLAYDVATCVLALGAGLARDRALCRAAIERLTPIGEPFATMGMVITVGPFGWFAGWAHAGLGDLAAALAANHRALVASREFGATAWVAQCLLQRAELLREPEPRTSRELALAAARTADGLGLTTLARRAGQLADSGSATSGGARRRQLLELAGQGLTNEEIARRLFVSVSTVERMFTQIYRMLGVRNRAEAVAVTLTEPGRGMNAG